MLATMHQFTDNITIATLYFSFIIIAVVVVIVYLTSILSKHKKEKKEDAKHISAYIIRQNDKEYDCLSLLYKSFLISRYHCIKTYHITQLTSKLSGILGLAFSTLGLASFANLFIIAEKEMQILVSLSSIIAVIIALYISPEIKFSQYVDAWRGYDDLIHIMKANIDYYRCADIDTIIECARDLQEKAKEIQKNISSDKL